MRITKFRGQNPETKEWFEGDLIHTNGKCLIGKDVKQEGPRSGIGYVTHEVDPATVGQFSGLTDKNGKEIWEGDVVKFHDHPTGIEDGIGGVYWQQGKWMLQWSMIPLGDYGTLWTEVIGNIHDNPELLTK